MFGEGKRFLLNVRGQFGAQEVTLWNYLEWVFFNLLVQLLRSKVPLMSAVLSEQLETEKFVEHQSRSYFCQPKQVVRFLSVSFFCCFFFFWLLCQDDQTR